MKTTSKERIINAFGNVCFEDMFQSINTEEFKLIWSEDEYFEKVEFLYDCVISIGTNVEDIENYFFIKENMLNLKGSFLILGVIRLYEYILYDENKCLKYINDNDLDYLNYPPYSFNVDIQNMDVEYLDVLSFDSIETKIFGLNLILNKITESFFLTGYNENSKSLFDNLKIRLSKTLDNLDKILLINNAITEHRQNHYHRLSIRKLENDEFIDRCNTEIKGIYNAIKIEEKLNNHKNTKGNIAIKSEVYLDKITKIDFIRIINAMYHLNYFVKSNKTEIVDKKEVMLSLGDFLHFNIPDFENQLSDALSNRTLDANSKIFKTLKNKETDIFEKLAESLLTQMSKDDKRFNN